MPVDMKYVQQLRDRAKEARYNHEADWDAISRLVVGRDQGWKSQRQDGTETNVGKTQRNYNSSPAIYQRQLAATLHVMLTNPAIRWFNLVTDDEQPTDRTAYASDVTRRVLEYLASPESMFPTAMDEFYMDVVAYGSACLFARPPKGGREPQDRLVRFKSIPIGSLSFLEDEEDEKSALFHDFTMTAAEIKTRWPDNVPERIQRAKPWERIELTHAVFRREFYEPGKKGSANMPWASCYMTRDCRDLLHETGMRSNPYLVGRWRKVPGDVWGDGPGHMSLAAVRTASAIKRTMLMAGQLATMPPLAVYANSMEGPIKWMPGAVNYMRASAREMPRPIETGANPAMGQVLLENELDMIRQAFYIHLLALPDRDRMTATEVTEHRMQKLETFSPIVSRLYSEVLTPVVMMTVQAMAEAEMLPPPPSGMDDMKLEFVGPLSQSQRSSETDSFTRMMMTAAPLLQVDPSVLVNLDPDYTFRSLGHLNNVNPRYFRAEREVQQIRQQEQEQAQQQQQLMSATEAAGAFRNAAAGAKDLGQT